MAFPISVSYTKRLKATITSDNQQQILNFIGESILKDKADNVVLEEKYVKYRGSTSAWRGSLFGSVDNGVFTLIYKSDGWWLNYQIKMRKLFVGAAILSGIMGVFAWANNGPWWVGIAAFLWFCGANWIINLIRHESVATTMAVEIDELICGKTELPEQDKMTGELKSWF
ncbi:MAG: hypothetical protein ABI113_05185 [Mucilaginibacter sp.]